MGGANLRNHGFDQSEIPSGNQTWQWKIHYEQVIYLLKPQFRVEFQLPLLITEGYRFSHMATVENGHQPRDLSMFHEINHGDVC